MKGKSRVIFVVAGLMLCASMAFGAQVIINGQQIQVQPGGQFQIQNGNGLFIMQNARQATAQPITPTTDSGDLLQFSDGSFLHGGLTRMDTVSGLRWESPAATSPIDFQPNHVDFIHFAHADSVTISPSARVRLANGDDLLGSVTSLSDEFLGFSAWFNNSLAIPRAAVQSITFLSSNYSIVYEGPSDAGGWIVDGHNPEPWLFRDGTFISVSPGALGRDFKLSGSSTIEFDAAAGDYFNLLVQLCCDDVEHMDYDNSYMLDITRKQIGLSHFASSRLMPDRNLGVAHVTNIERKGKFHVVIQCNKEEGAVAVFIDNALVKRWKDDKGFSATGGGILFRQNGASLPAIKLSNFKVSQWDGRFEPETSAITTNVDAIRFVNHDQAAGKIAGISGGKVALVLGETVLQIPLQRVTQINFATTPATTPQRGTWEVRAEFPGGGTISFQLQKWSEKKITGQSAVLGTLAFQTGQIRQLEFNLDRVTVATAPASDQTLKELDE